MSEQTEPALRTFGGQCWVDGCDRPVTIITQGAWRDARWCDTPGHARGLVLAQCD